MKPHLIFTAAGLVAALFSCQPAKNETAQHTEAKTDSSASVLCYQYAANKDTIRLQVTQAGNKVAGTLLYSLYEKDRNRGIIAGTLQGDLLLANYTFQSEGMTSVRQVAFKRKGNGWVEGYGDVTVQNDTVTFQNPDVLRFDDAFALKEVVCW